MICLLCSKPKTECFGMLCHETNEEYEVRINAGWSCRNHTTKVSCTQCEGHYQAYKTRVNICWSCNKLKTKGSCTHCDGTQEALNDALLQEPGGIELCKFWKWKRGRVIKWGKPLKNPVNVTGLTDEELFNLFKDIP